MTPFKKFFAEALSISSARKHKLTRKTSGAYTNQILKEFITIVKELVK